MEFARTGQRAWTTAILVMVALSLFGCRKKADVKTPEKPGAPETKEAPKGGAPEFTEIEWMTDWEQAKQTAKAQGKDLLIDFSGSDWCIWCKRLDSEVFAKPEFIAKAPGDFVFVLVDFPRDKSGQSQAVQQQNEKLKNDFGVRGFPTVFLATPDGKPYAQTGYKEGGPEAYLPHLEELRAQKDAPAPTN